MTNVLGVDESFRCQWLVGNKAIDIVCGSYGTIASWWRIRAHVHLCAKVDASYNGTIGFDKLGIKNAWVGRIDIGDGNGWRTLIIADYDERDVVADVVARAFLKALSYV